MCRARILKNLKGFGHKWVNPMCALRGPDGESRSADELSNLVREGLVEKRLITLGKDKFGRDVRAPLYRYNGPYDDPVTKHLSIVK